jgi:hypothetical protein
MNSIDELNRNGSFAQKIKAGWTKEQLIEYYSLTENQYDRVLLCLQEIHGKRTT